MPNTIEQIKPLNIFACFVSGEKNSFERLSDPTPEITVAYYNYEEGVAESIFGKSRFSKNVAVCQINVVKAMNVFDKDKSVYSDASVQYDIIVYKTDTYDQDHSVYISLYSKHGMAQFNAGIMSLPAAPIVVNTVCSTLSAAHDIILSTVEEHIKTLRLRLAESIKV